MKISLENAERLKEIAEQMTELLGEYKHIARNAMTSMEYQQFRYNTLSNLEPGLITGHEWVVGSHIKSLETVAERAIEDAIQDDSEDDSEDKE